MDTIRLNDFQKVKNYMLSDGFEINDKCYYKQVHTCRKEEGGFGSQSCLKDLTCILHLH